MTVVAKFEIEDLHGLGPGGTRVAPRVEAGSDPATQLPLFEQRLFTGAFVPQHMGRRGVDAPCLGRPAPHVDHRAATGGEAARVLEAIPDDLTLGH